MVTFNCEVCNDTVPKKNTEKHYYRCPDAYYTCIDCNKTFDDGISYKKHTQCISEDEKYQKGLYKGKKQGQGKQDMKGKQGQPGKEKQGQQENKQQENKKQENKQEQQSGKDATKSKLEGKAQSVATGSVVLKKGASLYKILKTVKNKDEKKNLLKKLVVNNEGHLVLQE